MTDTYDDWFKALAPDPPTFAHTLLSAPEIDLLARGLVALTGQQPPPDADAVACSQLVWRAQLSWDGVPDVALGPLATHLAELRHEVS